MKLCNFASLDPAQNGKGLQGASKADAAIMQEFLENPERIFLAAEGAYERAVTHKESAFADEAEPFVYDFDETQITERVVSAKARTVQGLFRKTVLTSYHCKCAVCQINTPELLVASHIVPWSHDVRTRMNPKNGIALCGLHDKAFDKGLFSLTDEYTILISKKLNGYKDNHFVNLMLYDFSKKAIHLPFRFTPDFECLDWHRKKFGYNDM